MAKANAVQHPAVAAVLAPLEGDKTALSKQGAEIDALLAQFKTIETPAQYEEACSLRARADAFVRNVEAKFSGTDKNPGPKALMYQAYKALGALEKDLSAPGVRVVDGLKRPILDFQDRRERLRLDEEDRLRRQAAANAAADVELDAMLAADEAESEGHAPAPAPVVAAALETAKAVAAATAFAAVTLPKSAFVPAIEGQTRSENWVAEITDVDALLRQLLDPGRQSIDQEDPAVKGWRARVIEALQPLANMKARDLKASGNGRFDGVRFYDDPKLSQRGARG